MGYFETNKLLLEPSTNCQRWTVQSEIRYHTFSGNTIVVPVGFQTDFASIPRFFWRILPPWDQHGKAAIIHDYCYAKQIFTREVCDRVFLEAMEDLNVPTWKRQAMYRAVRMFGWSAWNGHIKTAAKLAAMVALMLASGCQSIEYSEGAARFRRVAPPWADLKIEQLTVTKQTNGTVSVSIRGYESDQSTGFAAAVETGYKLGRKAASGGVAP